MIQVISVGLIVFISMSTGLMSMDTIILNKKTPREILINNALSYPNNGWFIRYQKEQKKQRYLLRKQNRKNKYLDIND